MTIASIWGWVQSSVSGLVAAAEATEKAYSGWSRLAKWYYGTIEITYPHNCTPVPPGEVEIGGKHTNPKGIYWLLTRGGDKYWPMCRITLDGDGTWSGKIHAGNHSGPRPCNVVLAWVSPYTNSLLTTICTKSRMAGNYDPISMTPAATQFCPVQAIKLNVERSSSRPVVRRSQVADFRAFLSPAPGSQGEVFSARPPEVLGATAFTS